VPKVMEEKFERASIQEQPSLHDTMKKGRRKTTCMRELATTVYCYHQTDMTLREMIYKQV